MSESHSWARSPKPSSRRFSQLRLEMIREEARRKAADLLRSNPADETPELKALTDYASQESPIRSRDMIEEGAAPASGPGESAMDPEDDPFQIATELSPVDQVPLRVKLRAETGRQTNWTDGSKRDVSVQGDGEPFMTNERGTDDKDQGQPEGAGDDPLDMAEAPGPETADMAAGEPAEEDDPDGLLQAYEDEDAGGEAIQPARADVLDAIRSIMKEPPFPQLQAKAPQVEPDSIAQRLVQTVAEPDFKAGAKWVGQGLGAFVEEPAAPPPATPDLFARQNGSLADEVTGSTPVDGIEPEEARQKQDDPILQTLAELQDLAKPLLRPAQDAVPAGAESEEVQDGEVEPSVAEEIREAAAEEASQDTGDLFAEDETGIGASADGDVEELTYEEDAETLDIGGPIEESVKDLHAENPEAEAAEEEPSATADSAEETGELPAVEDDGAQVSAEDASDAITKTASDDVVALEEVSSDAESAAVDVLTAEVDQTEEDSIEDEDGEEIWDAATYRPDLELAAVGKAALSDDNAAADIEDFVPAPIVNQPPVSIDAPGHLLSEIKDPSSDPDLRAVGEVSKETGVAPHVLRFWETRFSQLSPVYRGGQRCYRLEHVDLVKVIQRLLQTHNVPVRVVQRILSAHDPKMLIEANRLNMLDSVIPEQKMEPAGEADAKIDDAFDSLDTALSDGYADDGDQESGTDLYETLPASVVAAEALAFSGSGRLTGDQRQRLSAVLATLTDLKAEIAERRYMEARAGNLPGAIPELQDPLPNADTCPGADWY